MAPPAVSFRDLTSLEIERMLRRNHVGRIAFAQHDKVDIEPISYVYEDGALYCRTAPGTKLNVLATHPWVALELDEISGPLDWRSVVVKGTVYLVEQGEAPQLKEAYDHAVQVIRTLMPEAFTENDPVPFRTILFRLHIHELHGRAAESGGHGKHPTPTHQ
jgi:nitroimidazol reductase NimA-like FMN-containing flavoprotein (pyridoxamine 5'-phosphate oxidase superfamily)